MRCKRSLTLVEFLLIFCLLLVLAGTFAKYINATLRVARETALQSELNNLRMSIEHYRIIHGKLPQDLITLVNKSFTMKAANGIILSNNFIKPFRLDKQGYFLDPFMHRYTYDNKEGKVSSQTKGYEGW